MAKKETQTPAAMTATATDLATSTIEATKLAIDNEVKVAVERFSRDEYGLLKNVRYIFNDDSSVNWKAMIPKEYLVPNKEYFIARNIEVPTSGEGLDDKQLMILLGGFKELAKLRGVHCVNKHTIQCDANRAVVECTIHLMENYETRAGMPDSYTEVASATLDNTNSFSQYYLETIASNRAFVRAIRNALRIDIVGSDELGKVANAPLGEGSGTVSMTPSGSLQDAAKKLVTKDAPNGLKNFEEFQAFLIKKEYPNAETWTDWDTIPQEEIWTLITKLKKANSKQ